MHLSGNFTGSLKTFLSLHFINCHKSIQPELINVVTTQQGGGLEGDEGVGGLAL